MELFLIIIWNIFLFILGVVLRLALYSAKITLSLLAVPAKFGAAQAMRVATRRDKNTGVRVGAAAAYLALQATIAVLNLLIFLVDIFLFILATLGTLLGLVVIILMIAVIAAGAYIIILNDCSVGNDDAGKTSQTSGESNATSGVAGDSETAGQGEFTEEAKAWAKDFSVTYIGDSLGVGGEQHFKGYFTRAEYDSDGSRGIIVQKGMRTGEAGIETLKRLEKEGRIKENLVVALGTNNDVSTENLQKFYSEIPSSVKTITWVLTASEGGVDNKTINSTIKDFVNSHDNMRYLDFKKFVDNNGGWSSFDGGDGIHMSGEGYKKYVDFQTQGLYDLYGKVGASDSTSSSSSDEDKEDTDTQEEARGGRLDLVGGLYRYTTNSISTALEMKALADEAEDDIAKEEEENEKAAEGISQGRKLKGSDMEKALQNTYDKEMPGDQFGSQLQEGPQKVRKMMVEGMGFDLNSASTYPGHSPDQSLAIDFMTHKDYATGDTVAAFLIENMEELGIDYIIWGQKFYGPTDNIYGKAKTWHLMPDRGSWTQNHGDHVHVSFKAGVVPAKDVKLNDTGTGGKTDGQKANGAGMEDFGGKVGQVDDAMGGASFDSSDGESTTSNASKSSKLGCSFSLSKSGSSDSSDGEGGSTESAPDGEGTYPEGLDTIYRGNAVPKELEPYIIDPKKYGLKWEGTQADGWVGLGGQCPSISGSVGWQILMGDGQKKADTGNGSDVVDNFVAAGGGKIHKSTEPRKGAVFSAPAEVAEGHTGVVSHVFANGDVLILEVNSPASGSIHKTGTALNVMPTYDWNYRLVSKAEMSSYVFCHSDNMNIK